MRILRCPLVFQIITVCNLNIHNLNYIYIYKYIYTNKNIGSV